MKGRYKVLVVAAIGWGCLLATAYAQTKVGLSRYEIKYGVEKTIKAGEFWLSMYEKNWYRKPFDFPGKLVVENYIKNKKEQ